MPTGYGDRYDRHEYDQYQERYNPERYDQERYDQYPGRYGQDPYGQDPYGRDPYDRYDPPTQEFSRAQRMPPAPTPTRGVPVDRTASRGIPVDRTASRGIPVDRTASRGIPIDRTASRGIPIDRTASRGIPIDRGTGSIPVRNRGEVSREDLMNRGFRGREYSGAGRGLGRKPGGSGLGSDTPRLMRATVVIGLLAAVAAAVARGQIAGGVANLFQPTFMRSAATVPVQNTSALNQRNLAAGSNAVSRSRTVTGNSLATLNGQPATGTGALGTGTAAKGTPANGMTNNGMTANGMAGAAGTGADPAGTAGTTSATGGAAACRITYSIARAANRFTVMMVVANTSAATVNGWTLRWAFPPGQRIVYGWNAMVTNGAAGAVARDVGLNKTLVPGGSTTIGFVGSVQGQVPTPSGFTLNGAVCQSAPMNAAQ